VINSGQASYRQIRKTKEQLERADSKIIGCVLNKVDSSNNDYYYGYYHK
ncbi:tyrosine protein kinase, partial [Ligilactobacillus salivarius]